MSKKAKRGTAVFQSQVRLEIEQYLKKNKNDYEGAAIRFNRSLSSIYEIGKGKRKSSHERRGKPSEKRTEIESIIRLCHPKRSKFWHISLLSEKFKLSRRQVSRIVSDLGYKVSDISVLEVKSDHTKAWFRDKYDDLKNEARKHNAVICFGDDFHFKDDYLYATTSKGKTYYMSKRGRVTGVLINEFLKELTTNINKKVFFVAIDYPQFNKSDLNDWVSKNKHLIEVIYVPIKEFEKPEVKHRIIDDEEYNRMKAMLASSYPQP